MRVVKIIPYFGGWPSYLHLYLASCEANPSLEVVFVTDLPPFPRSPPNVKYFHLTLADVVDRARRTLGVEVPAIPPYKLCDFRPMYATLFPEVIQGADFWGYGDVDLVLGHLAGVLTHERLAAFDVLSFKRGHLQGPLTFYRNTPMVNGLFRVGGEYRRILATERYLSFDEFGPDVFYVHVRSRDEATKLPADNISVIAFREELAGRIRVYCEQHGREALRHRDVVEYRDGHVRDARSGKEFLFYHWVLEKRGVWFRYADWFESRPRHFYASTTGFYSTSEFRFFPVVHRWRLVVGALAWYWLRALNFVRRRTGSRIAVDTRPEVGWVARSERDGA